MRTDLLAPALVGTFSIWHWLIVLAVVVVLFGGRGRLSGIMRDVGVGITQFRRGLKDGGEEGAGEARRIADGSGGEASSSAPEQGRKD